jgi:large subunit ribosomal protein L1
MAKAKEETTKKKATKAEEVEIVEKVEATPAAEVNSEETVVEETPKATTKAGKRAPKAIKEAEAEKAKEERKHEIAEKSEEPKIISKPARSRLERRSKNYRKVAETIEKDKIYEPKEALEVLVKASPVKFDASVELHVNLAVDPRQADQNIRGGVALPAGTGKTVRIVVLAEPKDAEFAMKAGADKAGSDEILEQLEKGVIDFDILVATPAMMPKLGKYARVLGPKGLMPNPKSGTVTTDVAKAVSEAKAGRVEFRVDSTGIIHLAVGKVSFGPEKLLQNAEAVMASIKASKPASLKGTVFVKAVHMTTSMGPSVKVSF